MMISCMLPHPVPASPIKGEVPPCGWRRIVPQEWSGQLPLDGGGLGRGWSFVLDIEANCP